MANDLQSWPWIIDTPGPGVLFSGLWAIKNIRWVSPGAIAGHQAIVTDAEGRLIWESVAAGSNHVESEWMESFYPVRGIIVPTLSSGRLYIYVR